MTKNYIVSFFIIFIVIIGYFTIPDMRLINYVNKGQLLWAPKGIRGNVFKMFDNDFTTFIKFTPNKLIALKYDMKRQIRPFCFFLSESVNHYYSSTGNNKISGFEIRISQDNKSYKSIYDSRKNDHEINKEEQIVRDFTKTNTIIPYSEDEYFRYFKFIYYESVDPSKMQAITEVSVFNRFPFWAFISESVNY